MSAIDICIPFAWFLPEDDLVRSKDVGDTDAVSSLAYAISDPRKCKKERKKMKLNFESAGMKAQ